MTHRLSARFVRTTAIGVASIASFFYISSCSSGPLDISCSDFLAQSASQQLDTAAKWAHPNRDGTSDAGDQLVAGAYVKDLRTYCSNSAHASDKLKDLDLRF